MIGFVGQEPAIEALRFGIECGAPEQNIFVRGQTGTGRMSIVKRLLEEVGPACGTGDDLVYVHNFRSPDRPSLLTLPPLSARRFRRLVRDVATFVGEDLPKFLTGEAVQGDREQIEAAANAEIAELTEPFERDLREAGLAMVMQGQGQTAQTTIVPLHEGQPVGAQEMTALLQSKAIDEAQIAEWTARRQAFAKRLNEVSREVQRKRVATSRELLTLLEKTARELVEGSVAPIREEYEDVAGVGDFLSGLIEDVVDNLGHDRPAGQGPADLYDVNILLEFEGGERSPVVIETTPTLVKLLGSVETGWSPQGPTRGDFRSVSPGSILRANGGFLVLDARDLLREPGAWHVVIRALRSKQLEIVPQELATPYLRATIKPEPIPISLRVILIGDASTFYALDRADPDFGHLFKVLADFDSEIERGVPGVMQYAGVVAHVAREEGLPPFGRTAVAALAEHGARVAARAGRLTARYSRIADIAREAAYLAKRRGADVAADDVHETVRRTKSRANLASRRFHAMIANRTIIIETEGAVIGQVNGLATIQAGMLTYGFPARITATISPGNAGIIDIEGSASLSGQIHTKGFQILGGLLRYLLRTDHALAFSASLAFEQSYGGIDGDSASGAEICCLLSALTEIPLRQDVAMTGAIDQHGRIQAIGGVNEKIEGFFDAAHALGTSGHGGVIIPRSNAADLMLREDVVTACREGRFHIWAVATVQEALEVFTGMPAGEADEAGRYPADSLLGLAQERAHHFWNRSLTSPAAYAQAMQRGQPAQEGQAAADTPKA